MECNTEIPELVKARGRKETHGAVLWWLLSLGLTALPLGCVGMTQLILALDLISSTTVPNQHACPGVSLLTPSHQHRHLCLLMQPSKIRSDLSAGIDRPSASQSIRSRTCPTGSGCSSYPEIKLSCAILTNNLSVTDGICCPGVSATWLLLLQYLALRDRQRHQLWVPKGLTLSISKELQKTYFV